MSTQTIDQENETEIKGKKGRAKKPAFDLETATNADGETISLSEEGRLTEVPHNFDGSTRMPKRDDFEEVNLYFDFRVLREQMESAARIEELEAQRTEAIEGPDPIKKNMKKFQKMAANLEDLKAALEESGVNVSELL